MKKPMMIAALAALSVALAGCEKAAVAPTDSSADATPDMTMPVAIKGGKGTGTVTAIDAKSGKITLDHGPVVELEWPAMTMGFGVGPDLLKGIAVGDEVAFDVEWNGKSATVTSIRKTSP